MNSAVKEDGALTAVRPADQLSVGRIVGGRYRIDSLLGHGGMGEVWRAWDLKLRMEVALKAISRVGGVDERWREALIAEVRAARQVISPNVCRVFDIVEADGLDLVSMEYVDGRTLQEILYAEGPLEIRRAREIASQMLAGLGQIHSAGLIHRDLKPSNVMVTRTGRVVIIDLGLARRIEADAGSIVGTPAYMAPEQIAGARIDERADLYAAGMILAEMVAPEGVRDPEAQRRLWSALREDPLRVAETPWARVLEAVLHSNPERRCASAADLLRLIEAVSLRVDGAGELNPYPGLSAFTHENARYFFGRESEIEQVWRRLDHPHLQALIGPSGTGKSSFLCAGLVPHAPAGWRCIVARPGNRPLVNLARALAPELDDDRRTVDDLLRFEDPDIASALFARWRSRHHQVLVIIDQFEELFTQNPPELRQRFAELLASIPLKADAHVVLSMRDDFLFQCASYPALAPVFSEPFPLTIPSGPALRRIVVQPALECGYSFEDEMLVDSIVAEVEGERGALPLLAFAVAQLWERRDRDGGVLTRSAYEEIGGVAGALAQHAEATLDRIGPERVTIVRELFRNLVTAQGTRAARDRDELLSVFPEEQRIDVADVLDTLVGARLLTSYRVEDRG